MNVSTPTARRWVLVSVTGMLIVNTYRAKAGSEPFARRLWGTGMLAVLLGFTADFAPSIAGPFAILLLVGTLTQSGDKAIQNVLGKVGSVGGGTVGAPAGPQGPAGVPGTAVTVTAPAGPKGPAGKPSGGKKK